MPVEAIGIIHFLIFHVPYLLPGMHLLMRSQHMSDCGDIVDHEHFKIHPGFKIFKIRENKKFVPIGVR